MSKSIGERLFQSARDVLMKLGDTGTLVNVAQGEYNPQTGDRERTEITETIKYVIENMRGREVEQNLKGVDDALLTFATESDVRADWNIILNDGRKCFIRTLNKVSANDKIVIYQAIVRIQA